LENAEKMEAYPRLQWKSFLFFFQKQKDWNESGKMAGKIPEPFGSK
jgi:hypothetical protein